jgi:2-methylcitrate dehydratase PrpD
VIDYYGDKERKYRPQNELDAQMSLPYCLSVGLLNDGRVTTSDFNLERLSDPKVLAIASKVTAEADTELDKIPLKPMSMPAIVTVTTKDGRRFEKRVDHQKGDPRNPFSEDDFIAKFHECTDGILSTSLQQSVIDNIMCLDKLDDVAPLVSALIAPESKA